jgi:cell division septation protein DedD
VSEAEGRRRAGERLDGHYRRTTLDRIPKGAIAKMLEEVQRYSEPPGHQRPGECARYVMQGSEVWEHANVPASVAAPVAAPPPPPPAAADQAGNGPQADRPAKARGQAAAPEAPPTPVAEGPAQAVPAGPAPVGREEAAPIVLEPIEASILNALLSGVGQQANLLMLQRLVGAPSTHHVMEAFDGLRDKGLISEGKSKQVLDKVVAVASLRAAGQEPGKIPTVQVPQAVVPPPRQASPPTAAAEKLEKPSAKKVAKPKAEAVSAPAAQAEPARANAMAMFREVGFMITTTPEGSAFRGECAEGTIYAYGEKGKSMAQAKSFTLKLVGAGGDMLDMAVVDDPEAAIAWVNERRERSGPTPAA